MSAAAPASVASPTAPAPWGSPPTPLLPRWYIETLPSVPLPEVLRQASASSTAGREHRTVGDLATFWEQRTEPLEAHERDAITNLVYRCGAPSGGYVVLTPRMRPTYLFALPLRVRTANCIRRAFNTEQLAEGQPITVSDLLLLPNFGLLSLLDVMCVTEAAPIDQYTRSATTRDPLAPMDDAPEPTATDGTAPPPPPLDTLVAHAPEASDVHGRVWGAASPLLATLLAAASEFRGARTLADVLHLDLSEIAAILGLKEDLGEILLRDLCSGPGLATEAVSAIAELWARLSPTEQLILHQRTLATDPLTLEEIAGVSDVTRERIRQLQKRLEGKLRHSSDSAPAIESRIGTIAALLRPELTPVIAEDELDAVIRAILPDSSETTGSAPITELARNALRAELAYTFTDGVGYNEEAKEVLESVQRAAHSLADEVGLLLETDLQVWLPDNNWSRYWNALVDRLELHRLSGHLALRNTSKARVKAALLAIGGPATKEEVAARCGLSPGRTGAQLSALEGVVRADKVRWGLAEWIEDEYEGIPAEIIQRIEEDGGATRLERLLEELPRMFGVSEVSVRSYVGTPRFALKDGYVSMADVSSIVLQDLDDVAHGRLSDGSPYWCFKVEARYFDGFSLGGVPREIVKALGCEPDGRTRVWISSPPNCRRLSATWPLASVGGPSIGYLSEPLRRIDARAGDRVRLVIEAAGSVSLHLDTTNDPEESGGDSDDSTADAVRQVSPSAERSREFLERMKSRRRGF